MTGFAGLGGALLAQSSSNAALIMFLVYTLAVFGLAAVSNRLLQSKSFLSEYFLGSRSLGVWAFALTFAATSASGGSFTGFPSKIYMHGWILALWIGSYMVVPICTMGFLGKRINQVARISGAITVPDVLRDRFNSRSLGLLATVLIVFFMSFNLVAQFKAGSLILATLLQDVKAFHQTSAWVQQTATGLPMLDGVDGGYMVCLLTFGIAVILYTTWGGFHAVVWTDVLQGIVMVVGVLILLPLAISQVGGLESATRELAKMTPPESHYATLRFDRSIRAGERIPADTWLQMQDESGETDHLMRLAEAVMVPPNGAPLDAATVLEITTPAEIERILNDSKRFPIRHDIRVAWISGDDRAFGTVTIETSEPVSSPVQISRGRVFEFRAADGNPRYIRIERDAEISAGARSVDAVRVVAVARPGAGERNDRLSEESPRATVSAVNLSKPTYAGGNATPGVYVSGPGPDPKREDGFLPFGLAVSFFFMWAISGTGQPSSMVRLMAFRNAITLRRAIFTVAIYYSMIYFPLVVIFCCARILMPGMEAESDRIMPAMAVLLTENVGAGWLAGLLVAAPFAAVMSTVDSFLLMISSAIVRDVYQRNINPRASERTVKWMSYFCTLLVGSLAMLGALNPPQFLQDIIVYVGGGLAACFLGPMVFALYWPRVSLAGTISGMLAGFGAHLAMYVMGIPVNGSAAIR